MARLLHVTGGTLIVEAADSGAADPGFGNRPGGGYPSQPIYHPGHPDHGLPAQPGHPSQGLPGQPGHPSQGLPGQPGHPSQGLPWTPGHPDAGLPVPPGMTLPAPPANLQNKVVVLWHVPGDPQWHGKVMDPARPDQGLPPDPAQPKT